MFKVGDRVVVQTRYNYGSQQLSEDKVKTVHKNGQVVLEKEQAKFRANGTQAGKQSRWSPSRTLLPWSDDLWNAQQVELQKVSNLTKLHRLGAKFQTLSNHNSDQALALWDSLPDNLKEMI